MRFGGGGAAYVEDVLERRGGELGGDALVPGPRLLQRHAGRHGDDVRPHRRESPRHAPQRRRRRRRGGTLRPPRQRRRHGKPFFLSLSLSLF